MQVTINNQETQIEAQTVTGMTLELELPPSGIAIAVNQQIIPRSHWDETAIHPCDNITIIRATRGG